MYTYYSKHELEEHMLYAEEVAIVVGVQTVNGNTHNKFVHEYLKYFANKFINNYEQLYYLNKHGTLKKVYSRHLYLTAFRSLYNQLNIEEDKVYEVKVNNTTYKIKKNGGIFNA